MYGQYKCLYVIALNYYLTYILLANISVASDAAPQDSS